MASDVSSTEAVEPDDEKEEGELSLEDVSSSEEQQPYKFPPRAFGQCPYCLSTKRCHPWCRSLTFNGYYRDTQYPGIKDVELQGKENRKKQQSTKLPSDLSSISTSSTSTLQEKNDDELAVALSNDLVPISSDSDMELVGLYDDSKRRKRRKSSKKLKKKKREKSPSSCLNLALSIKDSIHKFETTGPVILPRKDSSSTSHIKLHRHHSPERKKVCFVKSSSPVRKHHRSPPVTRSHASSILVAVKRRSKPPASRKSPPPRHRSKTLTKKAIPVQHSVVDDALKDLPSPGGNVTKLLKKVRQLEPFSSRSKEKGSSLKDKLSNIIKIKCKPDDGKDKAEISDKKEVDKVEMEERKGGDAKEIDKVREKEKKIDSSDKPMDITKDVSEEGIREKSIEMSANSLEPESLVESCTNPSNIESGSKNEETKNLCDDKAPENEQMPISNTQEIVVETVAGHSSLESSEVARETLDVAHDQINSPKCEDSDPEMIEEPPPPESQKLPNFIMDDNDEDLELRMIALRSAVLKKHRTRIQSGKVKRKRAQPQESGSSSPAAVPRIESPFTSSFVEDFPLLAEVCRPETPTELKKDIYCSEDMELDSDMELAAMSDVDGSQSPYSPTDDVASLLLDQDETSKSVNVSLYTPSKPTETPRSVSSPSSRPTPGHLDGSYLERMAQESRPYSPTDLTIFDPDLPGLHPSAVEPTTALVPPPPPPAALGMFGQPIVLGCPGALLNPFVGPVAAHMVSSFPALHQACSPLVVPAPAGPLFAYPTVPATQVEVTPVEQLPARPAPEAEPQIEPALSDDFGETDLDGSPLVPMDTKELGSSSSAKWPLLGEPLYIKALDEPPSLVPSAVLRSNKQLLKQATLKRLQQQASRPRRASPQTFFKSARMTPVQPAVTGGLVFRPLKLQPITKRSAPLCAAPVFAEAATPNEEVDKAVQSRPDTPASSDRSSMTPSPRPGRRHRRVRRSLQKTNERWQELHSRALQEKNAKQRVERERQSTPILEEDEEALREKLLASLRRKKEMAAAAKQDSICEESSQQKEQSSTTAPLKRAAVAPPSMEKIVRKTVKRANSIPASTKVVNNAKRFQNQLQQRKLMQQKLTRTVSKLGIATKTLDAANLEVPQTGEGVKRVLFTLDDDTDSDTENATPVSPPKNRPILEIPTTDFEKSVDQFLKNVRQQHEQAAESHTEDQAVAEIAPKTLEEKITTVSIPSTSPTTKSDIADQLVDIKAVSAQLAASSPTRSLEANVAHKVSSIQVRSGLDSNLSSAAIDKNTVNKKKDCPATNILLMPLKKRPKNSSVALTGSNAEPTSSVLSIEKDSARKIITPISIKPGVAPINTASTSTAALDPVTKPQNDITNGIVGKTAVVSTVVRSAAPSVVTTARINTATTVAAIKPTPAVPDLSLAKKKLGLGSIRVLSYESPLLSLTVTPQAVKHLPLPQQEEYRRLKQQIIEREKMRLLKARELAASSSIKPTGNAAAASTSLAFRNRAASSSPKPGVSGSSVSLITANSSTTQSSKQISTSYPKTQLATTIDSGAKKARTTNASIVAGSARGTTTLVQVTKVFPNTSVGSGADACQNHNTAAKESSSIGNVPGKDQVDLLGKMNELLNNQKLKVSAVAQKVSKLRILTKEQMNNQQNTADQEPSNLSSQLVSLDPEKHDRTKRMPLLRILTKDQINQRVLNKEISAYDTDADNALRSKSQRFGSTQNTESRMKSSCADARSKNIAKAIENLSSNIYQSHDSWSDFKHKVGEEVQNFIDLSAENQKELLAVCEDKLIVKRHAVLDDITQMSRSLCQWEKEKDVQESLALEIQKLKEQLKVSEEKMQQQKSKLSTIQPKISKYHEIINSGRKECFRLSKICSKLGQQTVGSSYIVPSAGAELLTNRIKEVAAHSQKLKNRKAVNKNSVEIRDSSKADANISVDSTDTPNSHPIPDPSFRSLNPEEGIPETSAIPDNTNCGRENLTSTRDPDHIEKQNTNDNDVNMSAEVNDTSCNTSDHGKDMEVSPNAEETIDSDEKKFSTLNVKVEVKAEEIIPRPSFEDSKLSVLSAVKTEQSDDECKPSIDPTTDEAQSIKTEEQDDLDRLQSIPMNVQKNGNDCIDGTLHDGCSVFTNTQSSNLHSESFLSCEADQHYTGAPSNDDVTNQSSTSVNDADTIIFQPPNPTTESNRDEDLRSSYVQVGEVSDKITPDEVVGESSCAKSSSNLSHIIPIPNNLELVNRSHVSSNLVANLDDKSMVASENSPPNSSSEEMNEENRQNIPQDDSSTVITQDTKDLPPTTTSLAIPRKNDQQSLITSSLQFIGPQDGSRNHQVSSKSEDEMATHINETENTIPEKPSRTDQSCSSSKPVGKSIETSNSDVGNLHAKHDQNPFPISPGLVPHKIQNDTQKRLHSAKEVSLTENDFDESVAEITTEFSNVNNPAKYSSECSVTDNKSNTVAVAIDIDHNVTEQTLDSPGINCLTENVDSNSMGTNEELISPPVSATSEFHTLDDSSLIEKENLENYYLHKSIDDIINGRNEGSIFDSNPFQTSDDTCAEDSTFMEEIALLELANEMEVPEGIMDSQKTSTDVYEVHKKIMQDPKSSADANDGSDGITPDRAASVDVNDVPDKIMQDPKPFAVATSDGSDGITPDPTASTDVNNVPDKIMQEPEPFAVATDGSGGTTRNPETSDAKYDEITQDPKRCANANNDSDKVVQNSESSVKANGDSVAITQDPITSALASNAQKQSQQAQAMSSLLKKYKGQRKSLIKPYESVLELVRAPRNDKLNGILCPFELMGTCNDGDCQYIHQSTSHC